MENETHTPAPFNYDDLAAAISKLTPEQRKTQVYAIGEESSVKINELFIIDADIYAHKEDWEDRGTIEELKDIHGDDFIESNYVLSTKEGTPLLSEEI
jgi:hypothetical protein